jgi:hypothetical protein
MVCPLGAFLLLSVTDEDYIRAYFHDDMLLFLICKYRKN